MTTHELPRDAATPRDSAKRPYRTPQVIELGDVHELTRGSGGSKSDGKGQPATKM